MKYDNMKISYSPQALEDAFAHPPGLIATQAHELHIGGRHELNDSAAWIQAVSGIMNSKNPLEEVVERDRREWCFKSRARSSVGTLTCGGKR